MALGSFGRSVIFWLWVLCAPVLWGQPDNDHFRNAILLVGAELEFPVWLGDASLEEGEPNHLPEGWVEHAPEGPEQLESVWFSWIAPFSGVAEVYFPYYIQGRLARMYQGETIDALTPVPWGFRGFGRDSGYNFAVEGGTRYYLAIVSTWKPFDWTSQQRCRLKLKPPAGNDGFADAMELRGVERVVLAGGSLEAGEPHTGDRKVSFWWKWEAPANGSANIRIDWASSVSFGNFYLYEGESLDALRLVSSVAARNEFRETVVFSSEAGKTYHLAWVGELGERVETIQVTPQFAEIGLSSPLAGGHVEVGGVIPLEFELGSLETNTTGTLILRANNDSWSWLPPFPTQFAYTNKHPETVRFLLSYHDLEFWNPTYTEPVIIPVPHPYDDFADALEVTGTNFSPDVELIGSTLEAGEPFGQYNGRGSVWLRWVAPEDGLLREVTEQSRVELYTGTVVSNLTAVPTDSAMVGFPTRGAFIVSGGSTYHLQFLWSHWDSYSPQFEWAPLTELDPPPNDNFEAALDVTELAGVPPVHLFRATMEPEESWLNYRDKTAWYQYRASQEGVMTVGITGSGYLEGVFTGSSLEDLVPVSGEGGRFKIEPEATYYFQVVQDSTWLGYAQFLFDFAASPAEDRFENRLPMALNQEHLARVAGAWWEEGEPGGAQASLWYVVHAPEDGFMGVTGAVKATLWTGGTPGALTAAGWQVTAGTDYVLRIAGVPGHMEDPVPVTVHFFSGIIPGDEFETAVQINGTTGKFPLPFLGLTEAESDPAGGWVNGEPLKLAHTMWFQWTAPEDGTVTFSAPSSSRILTLMAGEGGSPEEMQWVASGQHQLRFRAQGGTDYMLFAGAQIGSLNELSMAFSTLWISAPKEGASMTTNEPVTVTVSEPVAGYDPEVERFEVWLKERWKNSAISILLPPGDSIYQTMPTNLPPGNYYIEAIARGVGGERIDLAVTSFAVRDPGLLHDAQESPKELTGRKIHYTLSDAERWNATLQVGEPGVSLPSWGRNGTLWFRWVAPANGVLSASNRRYSSLGVFYEEDTIAGLKQPPRASEMPPTFQVERGKGYLIQVVPEGEDWQLNLETFEVIAPVNEESYMAGEPVTFALETTEDRGEVETFSFYWNGLRVEELPWPPWELTTTNLPAGYGEVWAVLRTRSGEVVTNRPGTMLRVFPGNTSFGSALPLEPDAEEITFAGFIPPSSYSEVWQGPTLYFRYRPADDEFIYLEQADLKVFFRSIPIEPYLSDEQSGPIYKLLGGVEYRLQVDSPRAGSVSIGKAAPLANDDFANAKVLPDWLQEDWGGAISEWVEFPILASREAGEPGEKRSIWYAWRAPIEGLVVISGLEHKLFRGTTLEGLEEVEPKVEGIYPVEAGEHYRIAGYAPPTLSSGWLNLKLWDGRLAGDNFREAALIDERVENWVVFNPGYEASEPLHNGQRLHGSVWWKWVAPCDGRVTMQRSPLQAEPDWRWLFLYEGVDLWNLKRVEPVDSGVAWRRWWDVKEGTTYYLAYEDTHAPYGKLPNVEGFGFGMSCFARPANDAFAERELISGERVVRSGHGMMATREFGEPLHAGRYGGRSVWYEWQAPKDGVVTIRCWRNPLFAWESLGLLGVYVGNDVQGLIPVASGAAGVNTNVVSFEASAGQVYVLAVDSEILPQEFTLELELAPLPLMVETVRAAEEGILLRVWGATGEAVVEASVDLEVWEEWGTVAAGVEEVLVPYAEGEGRLFLRMRVENDQ